MGMLDSTPRSGMICGHPSVTRWLSAWKVTRIMREDALVNNSFPVSGNESLKLTQRTREFIALSGNPNMNFQALRARVSI